MQFKLHWVLSFPRPHDPMLSFLNYRLQSLSPMKPLIAIWFATLLILGSNPALAQDVSLQGIWFAWLETPSQHLRVMVRLESETVDETTNSVRFEGSITSPDQSPIAIPLTDCVLTSANEFEFRVAPSEVNKTNYVFRGKKGPETIEGFVEQGGASLPLNFQRVASLPEEGEKRLGADSAWIGEIDVAVRKINVRFRVYDTAPFASPEKPRVYFDSITENVNGFPVSLSQEDESKFIFSIAGVPGNSKYVAKLDPSLDRFQGRFVQGLLPLTLELTRVPELADTPNDNDALVRLVRKLESSASDATAMTTEGTKAVESEREAAQPSVEVPKIPGVREENFVVERVDYTKPKVKLDGKWVHPTFRISGTLTLPESATPNSNLPAVVMISGSGPQDRDETIGSHKPFQQLAHWFAKQGVASLRYDDRGVGASTGEFLSATTANFADDASAVWEFARGVEGIDRNRVGMLGHSEGGIIAPMVAANQPEVAFLLLLAPPGLPGGEVLATQIDRISELQGVSPENRQATMALQKDLQRLALALDPEDEDAIAQVRKAVLERWENLRSLSNTAPFEPDEARKQQVIDQIALQFQGLRTPWMRYFLAHDPAPNWLLFQCPTLALWGENDVQVLPYPNRDQLLKTIERNPTLRADLIVLSELNHLMQRAPTGLPSEYETIQETIDPSALEVILGWMKQQDLIR